MLLHMTKELEREREDDVGSCCRHVRVTNMALLNTFKTTKESRVKRDRWRDLAISRFKGMFMNMGHCERTDAVY